MNEFPAFLMIDRAAFNWQCEKWNLIPTPGVQPGTERATICTPDGTPAIFFICYTDVANITIHDTIGDTAVIIHD
jgi:hypothetical protein